VIEISQLKPNERNSELTVASKILGWAPKISQLKPSEKISELTVASDILGWAPVLGNKSADNRGTGDDNQKNYG